MKILITGANGFVGRGIIKELLDDGNEVIATDFATDLVDKRALRINCDLFSINDPFSYFRHPDCLLHLAWKDGFKHFSSYHIGDLHLHISFIEKMAISGIKQIAIMGSMHEIGFYEGCIDESTPCNPLNYYGIAKNALRQSAYIICQNNNVLFQWLRGFYIVSNSSNGDSVFSKIFQASQKGESSFPFTSGTNQFDFLDYSCFCKQIAASVEQSKVLGIINICSGYPQSLSSRVEKFISDNNLKIKLDYGAYPNRPYDSKAMWGNSSKINLILRQKRFFKKTIKILVTGCKGQLGFDCLRELKERGYNNVLGIDKNDLDITNEEEVHKFISNYKPDIVMHNAAWTAVDKAELLPKEVEKVNSFGTKYIADSCKEVGATMIYISTDYVFNGKGNKPFETTDKKDGLSVYGRTKAKGEDYVMNVLTNFFIVRISGAFGINGNNFVKTMLNLSQTHKDLFVVDDQIGSPTFTFDLSKLLCDMMVTTKYGIYHATNEGFISWATFAKQIFKYANVSTNIHPVSSSRYKKIVPNQANRPLNSRLSKTSLDNAGFKRLPNWRDATKRYINMLKNKGF